MTSWTQAFSRAPWTICWPRCAGRCKTADGPPRLVRDNPVCALACASGAAGAIDVGQRIPLRGNYQRETVNDSSYYSVLGLFGPRKSHHELLPSHVEDTV